MNALPDYHFLPAPLWLITVLHILTLTLHFVAMNFVFGSVVILLLGKFQDKWNHPLVQRIVHLLPVGMAATVTLGVAPLLFLQVVYPQQIYSAAIVSGWFFLLIIDVVILVYYFLYGASLAKKVSKLPALLTVVLLGLLYVAFTYSNVFSVAERPDLYHQLYARNQAGVLLNPEVGTWIWRWLHMLVGAVTVGGFFVALLGRKNDDAYTVGKTFFLWGMIANMIIGFVYLLSMLNIIKQFMHSPAVWFLGLAIVLSLGSLHFFFKKKFWPAGLMLFVSMLSMVSIRHIVRLLHLQGHFDPGTITINSQWGVFAMFLVCFLIALWFVWYMLKIFFGSQTVEKA